MLRVYKAYSEYVSGVAAAHGSHPSALLDAGKMFPFSFGSAMKNSDVPKLGCSAFCQVCQCCQSVYWSKSSSGPPVLLRPAALSWELCRLMRRVKRDVLRLITTLIEKTADQAPPLPRIL